MAAWNRTVENFLSHDKDTPASLAQALEADQDFALAWCAKGSFTMLLARAELAAPAHDALARAEASIRVRGATARERLYVEALRCATQGSFTGAIAALEAVLDAHPRDSLAAKLSHSLRFMLGDARGMRESIERVVARAGLDHPHLGYLLGCFAFALEETGAYREAERLGHRALERAPRDAWGLHAIVHVHEMTGRPQTGPTSSTSRAGLVRALQQLRRTICSGISRCFASSSEILTARFASMTSVSAPKRPTISATSPTPFRSLRGSKSPAPTSVRVGMSSGDRGAPDRRPFACVRQPPLRARAYRGGPMRRRAANWRPASAKAPILGIRQAIAREIGAPAAEALIAFGERRYGEAARRLLALAAEAAPDRRQQCAARPFRADAHRGLRSRRD